MSLCLRRQWSLADKIKIVQETLLPGGSIAHVAKKYSLHRNQISVWRGLSAAGKFDTLELERERATAAKSLSIIKKIAAGDPPNGRRSWSKLEKLQIVLESYDNKNSVTSVSRRYGINPNQIYYWRHKAASGAFTSSDPKLFSETGEKKLTRVLRSPQRRYWSLEEKHKIVEETFVANKSVSSVARKYKINPSQLFRWRMLYQ